MKVTVNNNGIKMVMVPNEPPKESVENNYGGKQLPQVTQRNSYSISHLLGTVTTL